MKRLISSSVVMTALVVTGALYLSHSAPEPYSSSPLKMRLLSDNGRSLTSFFDGVRETHSRIAKINGRWARIEAWLTARMGYVTDSQWAHRIGLTPVTVYAQGNLCTGSNQSDANKPCATNCGSPYACATGCGTDPCVGYNTGCQVCTACSSCPLTTYSHPTCTVPNCNSGCGCCHGCCDFCGNCF
jgi:hypothetical protein